MTVMFKETRRMGNDPLPPSIKHELARLSSYGLWIFGCRAAFFATHLAWYQMKILASYVLCACENELEEEVAAKVMDPVRETISKDVALLQLASSTAEFFPSSALIINKDVAFWCCLSLLLSLSRLGQECGCQGRCWTDRPRRKGVYASSTLAGRKTPEPVLLPLLLRYRWAD
uniref:Uncharacterized protein n=1 Tax=Ditylenchus dipsaci TaxID=166011 RepID=A0A915EM82_9BILA